MDSVIEFIKVNWLVLLSIALLLVDFFVSLFRKRTKVVDTIKEFILDNLPFYISNAEKLLSGGIEKKDYVINSVLRLLADRYPGINVLPYEAFISQSIEKILSTPEKKEVIK